MNCKMISGDRLRGNNPWGIISLVLEREAGVNGAVGDGSLPLDIALSKNSAERKGISSTVAVKTDLLIVPNIEVGNILGKSFVYFAKATMGCVVLRAKVPIILASRGASMDKKIASIAMASLMRL